MTTSRFLIAGFAALALFAAAPAGAQTLDSGKASGPGSDPARYEMRPAGDGFVRMDRNSGEMSYCALRGDRLVCKLAAEERDTYEREIARLQDRIDALEPEEGEGGNAQNKLDRRIDEAMQYADRALRRFFGMLEDLRAENEGKQKI